MKIPQEVLDFAKKDGFKKVILHPIFNEPYKGYTVYLAVENKERVGASEILVKDDEIRYATKEEYLNDLIAYW
ncbi:MAG: hypothetical protein IJ003_02660 [Candidatus Gastranaerophilales bacterium]|nr:hypothetical protein [Candidatus Gastranaerophilales bacterium]